MRKLLLAIAVLSTLLPLLEGRENRISQVRFQLQSLLDLLGGTPLRDSSRGNGVSQVGTMAEPIKPPCGKSAVACPVGPPLICCKPGQDCDKGVCKCSKTGRCLAKCGKGVCCVTADDSNGLCQCCLNTQDCDPSKGCQCGPTKCNDQCAKDPGSGATGCCMGTECKCCKKGQTCDTNTGCTLPCDDVKCKSQQPCGICVSGSCQPSVCPAGTSCNPTNGQCECAGTGGPCCLGGGTCTCCTPTQRCDSTGLGCVETCTNSKCKSDCTPTYVDGCCASDGQCQCCKMGKADCPSGSVIAQCTLCLSDSCNTTNCETCNAHSGLCEPDTCSPGLGCDKPNGGCICTDAACGSSCKDIGPPCCTLDRTTCQCCPEGWNCPSGKCVP